MTQWEVPKRAELIRSICEAQLAQLSELLSIQMGMYFPKERWNDLALGIKTAANEIGTGCHDPTCRSWLVWMAVMCTPASNVPGETAGSK